MLYSHGQYELWTVAWEGMNKEVSHADLIQLSVARGPSPEQLGEAQAVQELRPLLNDVFDPKQPGRLATWRAMTRSYMIHDPEAGYVLFGCVAPEYLPGSVPLLPAIFVSAEGRPGTWRYLGILKPEPKEESERRDRPVWSDGGGIVHLANGRWRIYLNGYNRGIGAAEAEKLEGPWKFLRDAKGEILDLTPQRGGIFPGVLRVSEDEWHMWVSDTWPVKEIRHLWSKDGLAWELYGRQPEITQESIGGRPIKCLRAYVDADGKHIVGLLSIAGKWKGDDETWVCHRSRMPAGPPLEKDATSQPAK